MLRQQPLLEIHLLFFDRCRLVLLLLYLLLWHLRQLLGWSGYPEPANLLHSALRLTDLLFCLRLEELGRFFLVAFLTELDQLGQFLLLL